MSKTKMCVTGKNKKH